MERDLKTIRKEHQEKHDYDPKKVTEEEVLISDSEISESESEKDKKNTEKFKDLLTGFVE
jgi:hypothetical protein